MLAEKAAGGTPEVVVAGAKLMGAARNYGLALESNGSGTDEVEAMRRRLLDAIFEATEQFEETVRGGRRPEERSVP
jgi:hypothetical protein